MKTTKRFSIFFLTFFLTFVFAATITRAENESEVKPCENDGTNVTFSVSVLSSDCPAMQNCTIHVVLYYRRTGAEIGSANYVYGTNTYNILVGYVDEGEEVCATLEVNGYCNPSITPSPDCTSAPYNTTKYLYVTYTCN